MWLLTGSLQGATWLLTGSLQEPHKPTAGATWQPSQAQCGPHGPNMAAHKPNVALTSPPQEPHKPTAGATWQPSQAQRGCSQAHCRSLTRPAHGPRGCSQAQRGCSQARCRSPRGRPQRPTAICPKEVQGRLRKTALTATRTQQPSHGSSPHRGATARTWQLSQGRNSPHMAASLHLAATAGHSMMQAFHAPPTCGLALRQVRRRRGACKQQLQCVRRLPQHVRALHKDGALPMAHTAHARGLRVCKSPGQWARAQCACIYAVASSSTRPWLRARPPALSRYDLRLCRAWALGRVKDRRQPKVGIFHTKAHFHPSTDWVVRGRHKPCAAHP